MVREHCLDVEFSRKPGDGLACGIVQYDQPASGPLQRGAQWLQRPQDELDAPVGPEPAFAQRIQDLAVEYEYAPHLPAVLHGIMQRRVVVGAQVAPEPDQAPPELAIDPVGQAARGSGVRIRAL